MSLVEDVEDTMDASSTRLGFFLALDEWQINDAVLIIENIDPDESTLDDTSNIFSFEKITLLNGETVPESDPDTGHPVHYNCEDMECDRCDSDHEELHKYLNRCKDTLRLLGKPSANLTSASPKEWIERSLSKNKRPVWLDWAIQHGLYTPVFHNADNSDTTKAISEHQVERQALNQSQESIKMRRHKAMLLAAKALNYEPTKIPHGGKKAIELYCLTNFQAIFTHETFLQAWKQRGDDLMVINHSAYSKRY